MTQNLQPFLAGSLAGVITKSATAPLERIKTMLQVEGMVIDKTKFKSVANKNTNSNNKVYRGIYHTARLIFTRDGVRGFWFGNFANCLRVVPVYALKFGFNDTIKEMIREDSNTKLSFPKLIAAGTLAGLLQMSITYPLETIRTRLTVGAVYGAQYNGIYHCFRSTLKHEGVVGLYKGLSASLLSGPLYVGLQMSSFVMISRQAEEHDILNNNKTIQAACSGALAGMIAQSITYPGDTIRKRMQTDGIRGSPRVYRGLIHCIVTIAREEGVRAFFSGLNANLIRCVPGAAIQFAAYGFWKHFLAETF